MTNFGVSLSLKVLGFGIALATMAACASATGGSEGSAAGEERLVAAPETTAAETCNCQYRNFEGNLCPAGTKPDPGTPVTGTLSLPAPANGLCQGAYEYGPVDIDPDQNEKPGDGYNAAVAALCKKVPTNTTIGTASLVAGDPVSVLGLVCGSKPGDPAPK